MFTDNDKIKHPRNIIVFGEITSVCGVMPLNIFTYDVTLNTDAYTKPPGPGTANPDRQNGFLKTLCLATGFCTRPNKQDNSVMSIRQFLCHHHLYQPAIQITRLLPLLTVCPAQLSETPTKLIVMPTLKSKDFDRGH